MLTVKGMCLFAMEVQAGAIDPPYTDARALTYARLADADGPGRQGGGDRLGVRCGSWRDVVDHAPT